MLGSTPNLEPHRASNCDVEPTVLVLNTGELPFHLQRSHTFSSSLRSASDKISKVGKGLKMRIYQSEATKLDCPDFDSSSGIGSEESSEGPSYISPTPDFNNGPTRRISDAPSITINEEPTRPRCSSDAPSITINEERTRCSSDAPSITINDEPTRPRCSSDAPNTRARSSTEIPSTRSSSDMITSSPFIPGRRIRSISEGMSKSNPNLELENEMDFNAALMRDYEDFMKEQNTESYIHAYTPNPPNPLSLSLSQGMLNTVEEEQSPTLAMQKSFSATFNTLSDSIRSIPQLNKKFKSEPNVGRRMEELMEGGEGRVTLDPAGTGVFLSDKREMLLMDPGENFECIVRDNDNEVRFQCVVSQEGIMCRNRNKCDLISIANSPQGVYVSIEGKGGCQVAKIKRGKTLSRVKTQVNLLTNEDRHALCISTRTLVTDVPILKQSLYVINDKRNIIKIVTKTNRTTVATIQRAQQRYYLYIEPNIDACFISALASYILRRKIFGDDMPEVLERRGNFITRRTRRLSMSFKKIRRNSSREESRRRTVISGSEEPGAASATGRSSGRSGYDGSLNRERHMTYG